MQLLDLEHDRVDLEIVAENLTVVLGEGRFKRNKHEQVELQLALCLCRNRLCRRILRKQRSKRVHQRCQEQRQDELELKDALPGGLHWILQRLAFFLQID